MEGVIQSQVMAHFMRQGPVQVVVVHQVVLLADTKDLMVNHDSIHQSRCWRQIGKADGRRTSVEFRDNPDVDVVRAGPVTQRFDVAF